MEEFLIIYLFGVLSAAVLSYMISRYKVNDFYVRDLLACVLSWVGIIVVVFLFVEFKISSNWSWWKKVSNKILILNKHARK